MSRSRSDEGDRRRPRRRRRRRNPSRAAAEAAREPLPPVPTVDPVPPVPPTPARPSEADQLAQIDESLLSPDERDYLEARRTAEAKIGLYREAVKLGIPVLLLLIFIPWVGVIVLCFGGIKLGRRFYRVMVEPKLRERLVREEVSKRVDASVHRERQVLEGRHSRSVEDLSASIAHEIRNPITAAKSLVQQMEEDPTSQDNPEYARVALGELQRVEKSISHLLRFAREEELRMQPVQMADVLDSALETFKDRAARSGVEINRQFDCEGSMHGDPEKLRRVFINLVGNAIDALGEGEVDKPAVEVSMGENLAGSEVWVRVRDNGPGIDPEIEQRIFNPFFTAKEGGTGLGLAITKKLVDAHGGSIEVQSESGHGTEFVLTFPKTGAQGGTS